MGGVPRGLAQAGEPAYKYTSFCVKYRAWAARLKRSMRQTHIAGEKLFVDYAGQTVPIVDAATGEIATAQIFVAVLGASNYTYAYATATQTAADWIGAHRPRAGVLRRRAAADRAGPAARADRAPGSLRAHGQSPGRGVVRRITRWRCCQRGRRIRATSPRSRSRVQVVERWILARLRNRTLLQPGRTQRRDRRAAASI